LGLAFTSRPCAGPGGAMDCSTAWLNAQRPRMRLQETAKCFPETLFSTLVRARGDESCSAAGYVNSESSALPCHVKPCHAGTHCCRAVPCHGKPAVYQALVARTWCYSHARLPAPGCHRAATPAHRAPACAHLSPPCSAMCHTVPLHGSPGSPC
jgi:hypothetical protein